MIRRSAYLVLASLLAVLTLGACQSMPGADSGEDDTGSLGANQESGPADVYVELAIVYLRDGDLATALKKSKRALDLNPAHAKGNGVIALVYERLGEAKLADTHFRRSLRGDGRNPYILNAYGAFLCKRRAFDQAVEQYEKALENPLYSTPEVALTNAGICRRRQGELAQAESYFRRALERDSRFPLALSQMAVLSNERENPLSARAYLERYLEVGEPNAELLWLGVRVERRLGDENAAQRYAERLLKTFPDSQEVQKLHESSKP